MILTIDLMKPDSRSIFILLILLNFVCLNACSSKPAPENKTMASPSPTPAPKPKPFIAYLKEGDLWAIRSDGTDGHVLAVAPEGQTIQDFVWSLDGSRVYYSVGSQFFEINIASSNIASAGELTAPPGMTIDRIEMGRDGKTMLVNAYDADTLPRLYSFTIGQREARELAIDDYTAMAAYRSPIVRAVGESSVSPDGNWVLFKDLAGTGEELFVANVETGARIRITDLYELSGFDESIETEGGRRVMEAAWSSDGRYVVFNPMQYCSEVGLCSGRLYLVEAFGGPQLQLSIDMMVSVPTGWSGDGNFLVYDDGSRVVVADTQGYPKALTEGHHPKWQPMMP